MTNNQTHTDVPRVAVALAIGGELMLPQSGQAQAATMSSTWRGGNAPFTGSAMRTPGTARQFRPRCADRMCRCG